MDFILYYFRALAVLLCLSSVGIIALSIYKKEYRDAFCDFFESVNTEVNNMFSDLRDTFK